MRILAILFGCLLVHFQAEAFNCDMVRGYHKKEDEARGRAGAEIQRQRALVVQEQQIQGQEQAKIAKIQRMLGLLTGGESRIQDTQSLLTTVEPILRHLLVADVGLTELNARLKETIEKVPGEDLSLLMQDILKKMDPNLTPFSKTLMVELIKIVKSRELHEREWNAQQVMLVDKLKMPTASALPLILNAIYESRELDSHQLQDSKQGRRDLEADIADHKTQIEASVARISQANQAIAAQEAAIQQSLRNDAAIDARAAKCSYSQMAERLETR